MNLRIEVPVSHRLSGAERRLAELIEKDGAFDDLRKTAEEIELLRKVDKRQRRNLDLIRMVVVAAVLACIAGTASLVHSGAASAVLTATVGGISITNDPGEQGRLQPTILSNVDATELIVESRHVPYPCLSLEKERAGCKVVERISIAYLRAGAFVKLHASSTLHCLSLRWIEGTSEFVFRTQPSADGTTSVLLGPRDTIRLCTRSPLRATFRHVTQATLANPDSQTATLIPTLTTGRLAFPSFGKQLDLSGTDAVDALLEKDGGLLILDQEEELKVHMAGTVRSAVVVQNHRFHRVMPTWLDWLRHSPQLHGVLSILLGVAAFVWAAREKLSSL